MNNQYTEYLNYSYDDYLFRISEQLYALDFDIWMYRYTSDDAKKRDAMRIIVEQLKLIRDELERYRDEHR